MSYTSLCGMSMSYQSSKGISCAFMLPFFAICIVNLLDYNKRILEMKHSGLYVFD